MNHYSIMNGYFRFKRLWRNRYITRNREVKLRCLLENIIISLYKYVDLASKFLIKMLAKKEPPSYRFTSTPLAATTPSPTPMFVTIKRRNLLKGVHPNFLKVLD